MGGKTKIEWTDKTINPIIGCTKISDGCKNCYAERMAKRQKAMGTRGYDSVVDDNGWTGKLSFISSELEKPYKWQKSSMIFICSMSDLFHPETGHSGCQELRKIFRMISENPQHTFQIVTKRPQNALQWVQAFEVGSGKPNRLDWPSNCWFGFTAENQQALDERAYYALQIPAPIVFVSVEPMLEAISFSKWIHPHYESTTGNCSQQIGWVIVGGESGPNARPMHPDWVRSIRGQCNNAGVPFFFKQWGAWRCTNGGYVLIDKKKAGRMLDGVEYSEFPEVDNERD